MYYKKIELENFRNYEKQEIELINGINLFLGDNAQGKTNIIEALYMSAIGTSYRTNKDGDTIMFSKEYCKINANYIKNNSENTMSFYIDSLNRKQIKNNEIKIKKLVDYVGEIPIVIFSPESIDIVTGTPSNRRSFLNMICCQISKSYIIYHNEYNKCLKLKNKMLKSDFVDDDYILVLHEKMSKCIKYIVELRDKVINMLNEYGNIIHKNITGNAEEIKLVYNTDFLNMSEDEIKKYLDDHLFIDKQRFSSIKGIQRDDMEIYIISSKGTCLVSEFGSQGQKRTSILTLKLANFELLKKEKNEIPILLLDDIMSELDSTRINYMLKYIEDYQSIITTTNDTFTKDIDNIKIFKVSNGTLEN